MTYLDAVMASVPRDYWKLDEFGSTVTALNTTGTVVGHYIAAPTLTVPGPLKLEDDSAVSFNAPDVQFVDISGASVVSLTQFSVEFWVKGASQSGAVVYSETSSSGSALFTFACSATNKLVVTIVDDSAATKLALTSTATVFDGNWHHVVFTSDVGLYRLYVDAVQSNTSTYTPGTLTINASALATEIHDAGNLNYFTGSIDEVATYASILSAADIATHYRAAFTTFVMVDALLKKPNITYSVQVDAKLKKRLSTTVDALLVNPAGTFRGTGTTAERDALVALQAKDTWINTEAKQQQYWTGSAWLSAGSIASPSSGQDQNIMAPTTAGWRAEMGDATYPIRYWNGTTAKFTVDNAGNVIAIGTVTAGSFIGGSIDIPSVGGTGFHVDSSGNVGAGGVDSMTGTFTVNASTGALVGSGATLHTVTVDGGINASGSGILFGPSGGDIDALGYLQLPEIADTFQVPARVQIVGPTSTGSSTTPTASAWSSATTAGNLLMMVVRWVGAGPPTVSTPPAGYTLASPISTVSTARLAVYYKENCGAGESAPSLTLSGTATWNVTTLEYSGIKTSSSLDVQADSSLSPGVGTTMATGSATSTQTAELWLVAGYNLAGRSYSSPTNGYAEIADSAGMGAWERIASSTGSVDMQATMSGISSYLTKLVTFKAAVQSGVATPAADRIRFYAKDKSGVSNLVFKNDAGTEIDLSTVSGNILTTKGDVLTYSTVPARLGVGANTFVLTADSTTATGLKWAAPAGGTTMATDTLWDALGDLAYGSGADTGAKLAGNTTTTKKFLAQTGNGTISAAPAWSTIDLSSADVTGVLAAARFPALTGDVTTSSGSLATTLAAGSASNLNSGTLLAARMPALTGDVTTSAGAVATTIANDAVTYAKFQNIATDSLLGRDTAGTGDPENILLNATLSMDGSGNLQRAALTGDVTASAGSNATTLAAGSASNLNSGTLPSGRMPALTGDVTTSAGAVATTIANAAVSLAKMANIATDSLIGRDTAGTGVPENILLDNTLGMDGSGNLRRAALIGDVTAPAGSNTTTLAAGSASNLNSGTLAAGRMPALTGDVTTSAGAVATTIANDAVSYAKMQNVSATSRFLGRITAGAGDPEELTAANAKTILALQASDLSDNANLAKLNAGNTFTVTPQTLTIDAAGHVGLQINLAAAQTARAIQVTDSDGVQAFQMAGSGADILITQYAASPQISGRRAEGTNLLPTAVAADSIGLGLGFRGYGTSFATQDKANIALTAAELWSATAQGTYIDFTTTKKAGTTRTAYFRMTDDGGFRLAEVATPANPASGFGLLYAGTDSLPHYINDGPINFNLSASTATPITTDATAAAAGTRTNPLSPDDHRHQLGAHGDASHTDTTRSMQQWSVENFVLDSGTSVTIGAVPTAIASVNLADAATQGFYFDFLVPADWASGAITAYIYWSPGTTDSNAAHTVRWQFAVTEVTAGSTDLTAAASSTTAWTGTAQAHTINLQYTDSNTLLTPNAANRLVKVNVRRLGSDAADTYVGAVRVTTMRLEYTATR